MRADGRAANQLREVKFSRGYIKHAEGSVLVEAGDTRVICTASLEEKVPSFLKGTGRGWVTAEYSMLPRATEIRNVRDISRGRLSGRSQEIQRLVGRALRSVVRLEALGERTIWLDCDVLQADGGTRAAAITGGFVALVDALAGFWEKGGQAGRFPVEDFLGAISVGMVDGLALLDLTFPEDSRADVDLNVVMRGDGRLVEVQGTAEGEPMERDVLFSLLDVADQGIQQLIEMQRLALGAHAELVGR